MWLFSSVFIGDSSKSHSLSHSSSNHSTPLGTYAVAPAVTLHHHQSADMMMVKKKKKEEKERDKHDKDKVMLSFTSRLRFS